MNLFNDKTVAALKSAKPDQKGLIDFMSIIIKWWNIVNVKTLFKGKAKRLPDDEPITSIDSPPNLYFLQNFVLWLQAWKNTKVIINNNPISNRAFKFSI